MEICLNPHYVVQYLPSSHMLGNKGGGGGGHIYVGGRGGGNGEFPMMGRGEASRLDKVTCERR